MILYDLVGIILYDFEWFSMILNNSVRVIL